MPLVDGNELSFFSISFTICFYLLINESSVWWQEEAGGCLPAAATQLVKPHYVSFAHTCRCNQPYAHAHKYTHTCAHKNTQRKTYFSVCYTQESRMQE